MLQLAHFSPSHLASYSVGSASPVLGGGFVCKDVILKPDKNLPLSKVFTIEE